MAQQWRTYYATPRDWHDFLKRYVRIQAHGQTHEGWLNNINESRHLIGIDDIQENLIWEAAVDPNTKWFGFKDTLLCEFMEDRP